MTDFIPLDSGCISVSAGRVEGSPAVILHLPGARADKAIALDVKGGFSLAVGILRAVARVGSTGEIKRALSAISVLGTD